MMQILIPQKSVEALKGEEHMHAHLIPTEKIEMNDKAISAIIMFLGYKVLREVERENIVVSMWNKLDSLYMTKSVTHRQCLGPLRISRIQCFMVKRALSL